MKSESQDTGLQRQLKLKFGEKPKSLQQGKSNVFPLPDSSYSKSLILGERQKDGKVVIASLPYENKGQFLERLGLCKLMNGKLFIPLHISLGPRGYGTIRPALTKELL